MLNPEVGTYYDRLSIEKSTVSQDAAFFQRATSVSEVSDHVVVQEYPGTIIIWVLGDKVLKSVIDRLIANGVQFTYQFREFKMKHHYHLHGEEVES